MNSVDNRIVRMEFDNTRFEQNAQTSLGTIDKLKNSFNFDKSVKGLDKLNGSMGKFSAAPIASAVATASNHFSALEIAGITAISNITTKIQMMGERLIDAVAIDPVRSGFSEYEEKMDSIKLILNSAKDEFGNAVGLDVVKKKIEELNIYADKTIYSFADMTNNIGKFTNAGVDLNTSVAAIQGISNAAALAGANSNDASRAMYNFAQALSVGYIQRIDWKSIENANMATVDFKKQLLETALACGTVKQNADGMWESLTTNNNGKTSGPLAEAAMFTEALDTKWLTNDVLIQTLQKYSSETTEIGKRAYKAAEEVFTLSKMFDTLKEALQSGWSQSWEYIIGDYEQAGKLLTEMNDKISGFFGIIDQNRNNVLNEVFNGIVASENFDLDKWRQMKKEMDPQAYKDYERIVKQIAKEQGVEIDKMIKEHGSFTESLKEGWLTDKIANDAKTYINTLQETVDGTKRSYDDYNKIAKEVIEGKWGDGTKRIEDLTKAGYNYVTVQKFMSSGEERSAETVKKLKQEIKDYNSTLIDNKDQLLKVAKSSQDAIKAIAGETYRVFDAKKWRQMKKNLDPKAYEYYKNVVKQVAKEQGVEVDKLIENHGSFSKSLKEGWLTDKIMKDADEYIKGLDETVEGSKKSYEDYKKVAKEVIDGKWSDGEKSIKSLEKAGYNYTLIQDLVNAKLSDNKTNIDKAKNAIKEYNKSLRISKESLQKVSESAQKTMDSMNVEGKYKKTGRELIVEVATKILSDFKTVCEEVKKAYEDIFPKSNKAEGIYNLIKRFHDFTESIKLSDTTLNNVRSTFRGIFAAIDIFKISLSALISGVLNVSKNMGFLGGIFFAFTARIGDAVTGIHDFIKENDIFGAMVRNVVGHINNFINSLRMIGENKTLKDGFSKIITYIEQAKEHIIQWYNTVLKGDKLVSKIPGYNKFKNFFKNLGDTLKNFNFNPIFDFVDAIKKFVVNIVDFNKIDPSGILNFFKGIVDTLTTNIQSLTDSQNAIKGIFGVFGDAKEGAEPIKIFGDTLKDVVEKLGDKKEGFKQTLIDLGKAIVEGVQSINVNNVLKTGGLVILIKILFELSKTMENFKKITKNIAKWSDLSKDNNIFNVILNNNPITGGIIKNLTELSNYIKTEAKTLTAEAFYTIAKGIMVIAVSLVGLAQVPEDKLAGVVTYVLMILFVINMLLKTGFKFLNRSKDGEKSISTIKEALANFVTDMKDSFQNATKLVSIGLMMVAFASAIYIVVQAFNELANSTAGIIRSAAAFGMIAILMAAFWYFTKDLSKNASEMSMGVGAAIIGMAAGIYILAKAIEALAAIKNPIKMIGATLAVAALMCTMSEVSKKIDNTKILKTALGMIGMAAAMTLLIVPIYALGKMGETAEYGIAVLAGCLATMVIAIRYLNDLNPLKAAGGILILSAAFALLTIPLLALGTFADKAGAGVGILMVTMLTMVGVMLAIKDADPLKAAGGMVAMALAMDLLMGPIVLLGLVAPVAGLGLGVLISALFTFGVAAFFLSKLTAAIDQMVASLSMFGMSLVALAVGPILVATAFLIFAHAINLLGDAFPHLVDGIIKAGNTIIEHQDEFVEGVQALILGIATAIIATAPTVGVAIAAVISSVIYAVANTVIVALADGITMMALSIIQNADKIVGAIVAVVRAVEALIGRLIAEILLEIGDKLGPLGGLFTKLGNDIIKSNDKIQAELESKYLPEEARTQGLTIGSKMAEGITFGIDQGKDALNAATGQAGEEAAETMMDSSSNTIMDNENVLQTAMSTVMSNSADGAVDGVGEGMVDKITNEALQGISDNKGSVQKSLQDMVNTDDLSSKINVDVDTSSIDKSSKDVGKSITGGISGSKEKAKSDTKDLVKTVGTTLGNNANLVDKGSKAVGERIPKGIKESAINYWDNGTAKNTVMGLANALDKYMKTLYNKGAAMARQVNKGYTETVEQHSPSKLFFRNGVFTVQGLLNGLNKNMGKLSDTGGLMGETVHNSLQKALSGISNTGLDLDATPVIRPVMDLSDVNAGSRTINGMFGSMGLGVGFNNVNGILGSMRARQNRSTNDDVVNAVNGLRDDLSNLDRPTYNVNGVTYDDGSNVSDSVKSLIRAVRIERRA